MTKRIVADVARIAAFVIPRTKMTGCSIEDFTAIGVEEDGEIIGGVLYENYSGFGGCIEMHVAGDNPHWITKDMLKVAFHYPFVQLGCKVVRGRVPSDNMPALSFDLKLGFKTEHLLRDARPDGDDWLLIMRREDCRFLEKKHGK